MGGAGKVKRFIIFIARNILIGACVMLGGLLVGVAGFVAVAPDAARELILNQELTVELPMVTVEVSLGDELTELLKEIRDGLR